MKGSTEPRMEEGQRPFFATFPIKVGSSGIPLFRKDESLQNKSTVYYFAARFVVTTRIYCVLEAWAKVEQEVLTSNPKGCGETSSKEGSDPSMTKSTRLRGLGGVPGCWVPGYWVPGYGMRAFD